MIFSSADAPFYLVRDGTFLNSGLPGTIACWCQMSSVLPPAGKFRSLWMHGDDAAIWLQVRSAVHTNNWYVRKKYTFTQYVTAAYTTLPQSVYLVVQWDGSTLTLTVDGVEIGAVAAGGSLGTLAQTIQYVLRGATSEAANVFADMGIERLRIWQRKLTAEELAIERETLLAQSHVSLLSDNPLISLTDLLDYSGNHRDFMLVREEITRAAAIYVLTGQVRAGGNTILAFVGPAGRVVEWSLVEGAGSLIPFTYYTDEWGRASCLYQSGGYEGPLTVQVSYGA